MPTYVVSDLQSPKALTAGSALSVIMHHSPSPATMPHLAAKSTKAGMTTHAPLVYLISAVGKSKKEKREKSASTHFFRLSHRRDEVDQGCMGRHSRFGALSLTDLGRCEGKEGAIVEHRQYWGRCDDDERAISKRARSGEYNHGSNQSVAATSNSLCYRRRILLPPSK